MTFPRTGPTLELAGQSRPVIRNGVIYDRQKNELTQKIEARNQRIASALVALGARFIYSDDQAHFEIQSLTVEDETLRCLDLFCQGEMIEWRVPLHTYHVPHYLSEKSVNRLFYNLVKAAGYGELKPNCGELCIHIDTFDEAELFETLRRTDARLEKLRKQVVSEVSRQHFESELEDLAA